MNNDNNNLGADRRQEIDGEVIQSAEKISSMGNDETNVLLSNNNTETGGANNSNDKPDLHHHNTAGVNNDYTSSNHDQRGLDNHTESSEQIRFRILSGGAKNVAKQTTRKRNMIAGEAGDEEGCIKVGDSTIISQHHHQYGMMQPIKFEIPDDDDDDDDNNGVLLSTNQYYYQRQDEDVGDRNGGQAAEEQFLYQQEREVDDVDVEEDLPMANQQQGLIKNVPRSMRVGQVVFECQDGSKSVDGFPVYAKQLLSFFGAESVLLVPQDAHENKRIVSNGVPQKLAEPMPSSGLTFLIDMSKLKYVQDINVDSYGGWCAGNSKASSRSRFYVASSTGDLSRVVMADHPNRAPPSRAYDIKLTQTKYKHPGTNGKFQKFVFVVRDKLGSPRRWAAVTYRWLCTPFVPIIQPHGNSLRHRALQRTAVSGEAPLFQQPYAVANSPTLNDVESPLNKIGRKLPYNNVGSGRRVGDDEWAYHRKSERSDEEMVSMYQPLLPLQQSARGVDGRIIVDNTDSSPLLIPSSSSSIGNMMATTSSIHNNGSNNYNNVIYQQQQQQFFTNSRDDFIALESNVGNELVGQSGDGASTNTAENFVQALS